MGESQTLLPSLADVIASLESIFAVNTFSGLRVHNVNTYTEEVRSLTTVAVAAPRFSLHTSPLGEMYPVMMENRAFTTSVIANILEYGQVSVHYSNAASEVRALAAVSPFLLVSGFLSTNGSDFTSLITGTARQVFSHIDWDFDWRKRELVRGSALFGSESNCIGALVRFNGAPDKVKSARAFTRFNLGCVNVAALLRMGKTRSATMWITGKVLDECDFGVRLAGDERRTISARCGWRAAIGKCIVKGGFGIDGLVSSEISAKLTENVRLTVATAVDHRLKDCTLGFDIMTETKPFAE